jgi:single-strand DNA-binding protein
MAKLSINRVTLIGDLSDTPDYRVTPNGTPVTSATLVTTESWEDRNDQPQERKQWHQLVFWRTNAQSAKEDLILGSQVFVEGRLQTRSWEDRRGLKRYVTEVIVLEFLILDQPEVQDAV